MVKLSIQVELEDCLNACLNTVRHYLMAYAELEKRKVCIADLIKVVRSSQTEVDAIDNLKKEFNLSQASSEALLEMPLRKLYSRENKAYYENVLKHLSAIDLI